MRSTLLLLLIATAARAGDSNQRSMWLSGGNSQAILAEPTHPSEWKPEQPITSFVVETTLPHNYPVQFVAWPSFAELKKRKLSAGAEVPMLSVQCVVDARTARFKATCADGRTMQPVHLAETYNPRATNERACFQLREVAPTELELRTIEKALAGGRELDAADFTDGSRAVLISYVHRQLLKTKVELPGRTLADVAVRNVNGAAAWLPKIVQQNLSFPLAVPMTDAKKPDKSFGELLMLGMSFPGRTEYLARGLQALKLEGLEPKLQAMVLYDRAAMSFAIGDRDQGAKAVGELDALLKRADLPADLAAIIKPYLPRLHELADGTLLMSDPCAQPGALP